MRAVWLHSPDRREDGERTSSTKMPPCCCSPEVGEDALDSLDQKPAPLCRGAPGRMNEAMLFAMASLPVTGAIGILW